MFCVQSLKFDEFDGLEKALYPLQFKTLVDHSDFQ